jgi:hypothetical protein
MWQFTPIRSIALPNNRRPIGSDVGVFAAAISVRFRPRVEIRLHKGGQLAAQILHRILGNEDRGGTSIVLGKAQFQIDTAVGVLARPALKRERKELGYLSHHESPKVGEENAPTVTEADARETPDPGIGGGEGE